MRGSATTAFRAFLMLACSVAIPVLAIWGASWSDIAKKFQNFHCPAILNLASASPAAPTSSADAPRLASRSPTIESPPTSPVAPALPIAAAQPARPVPIPSDYGEIQERLKKLGATYYVLESWGNDQQLYRFFCKMAVAGDTDYVHCFEATHSDPLRAMQQVLQKVETWRAERRCGG